MPPAASNPFPSSRNEHIKLLRADSILWKHITPGRAPVKPSQVQTVFVTGASGTLGPYVLRDLSQRPKINKIYCLLRKTNTGLQERLIARLKELNILDEVDLSKIEPIEGNITEDGFGLSDEAYEDLADSVDAVIHLAVYANHLLQYSAFSNSPNSLRSVNVLGTQRILEFAAYNQTKLVYHASTFFAGGVSKMFSADVDELETWPQDYEFEDLPQFGYGESKFCADRLMEQAIERGIPCKAFRFAKIGGDSRDGRQSVRTNHFFIKFLYYMKAETMPDLQVPMQLVAVDTCAKVTLDVFFHDDAPSTIYNLYNPHKQAETDIVDLAKEFGFNVNTVKYEEFTKKLVSDGEKALLYHWTPFYTSEYSLFRIFAALEMDGKVPLLDAWKRDPYVFNKSKIHKYIPNLGEIIDPPIDILRKEVKYAIRQYDIFRNQ